MGALVRERYMLKCSRCGMVGAAMWWETDRCVHLRHPAWGLDVSDNFERMPGPESYGPGSFYGRPLVCKACGVNAEPTEIDSAQFFSIERPAMRPVAGSHFKSSSPVKGS
jgi:hypothetical protein